MRKKSYVEMLKECLGFQNVKDIQRVENGWYILEEDTIVLRGKKCTEVIKHLYMENSVYAALIEAAREEIKEQRIKILFKSIEIRIEF